MAKGILNIQAADGAVIGLHVPDGLTSGERPISLGVNLSGITAYHLLQGNLAVSTSTITQGFNTTLYTGNGSTQSINTGIDMNTQWGNDASETFGGLVWIKSRSTAMHNALVDTVRGTQQTIYSNLTNAQANDLTVTSFNNSGYSISTNANINQASATYASWNFQTTHRITGTTNHGKPYTCHYNPYTGFTIVKYEGSGLAGHEIPHHLGRKLGLVVRKNLSAASDWVTVGTVLGDNGFVFLNLTTSLNTSANIQAQQDNSTLCWGAFTDNNAASNQYILYGWANSYFDEANKLIGNYEIGVYQGTGASGNKVTTRGKPAWVMIKRLDSTGGNWRIFDNQRPYTLFPSVSTAETNESNKPTFNSDGFIVNTTDIENNASGGQYLYMVAYDTNANGGGSYYPLASDAANVQVNNALIPIAQGIDSNGAKNTILSKNETFSGITYTQGKNYLYYDALGNRGVSVHKPRYLESELVRTYAGESPDYFNVKENKWYSTNSGSELVTNGAFTSNVSGWTAYLGGTITWVSGVARVQRSTDGNSGAYKEVSVPIGVPVKVSASITKGNDNFGAINIRDILSGATLKQIRSDGIKEVTVVSSTGSLFLMVTSDSNGLYCEIDNISVFEAVIKPTTEITNGRNYLNHIVYADNDGGVLYVEELPKIEYKDIVKANEYKGKNACTAWVNFDGTTTPPTIRDSYNVAGVVRTATGVYDVYFAAPMDNANYVCTGMARDTEDDFPGLGVFRKLSDTKTTSVFRINIYYTSTAYNSNEVNIQIFGGRN